MRYVSSLIAVKDIAASKQFYVDVMGQKIVADVGANVAFENGLSLQELKWWADFIDTEEKDILFDAKNAELYFETDDYDKDVQRLKQFEIDYVHDTKEFPWGQRVIRFYDPDKHIIEVGETMQTVVKRFFDQGLGIEEIVEKTMMPKEYIESLM